MDLVKNISRKISGRFWATLGLMGLLAGLCLPANLFGESLIRTISLEASDQEQEVAIPVGSSVTFLNNYPQELYATSIIKNYPDVKLLSIESFPSGQTFGLEFPKKGPYSICYSLNPLKDSTDPICLQINVVPLQTA